MPHVTQARALRSSTWRQVGVEQRAWTSQLGQEFARAGSGDSHGGQWPVFVSSVSQVRCIERSGGVRAGMTGSDTGTRVLFSTLRYRNEARTGSPGESTSQMAA